MFGHRIEMNIDDERQNIALDGITENNLRDLDCLPSLDNFTDATKFMREDRREQIIGLQQDKVRSPFYRKMQTDPHSLYWGIYFDSRLVGITGLYGIRQNYDLPEYTEATAMIYILDNDLHGKRIGGTAQKMRTGAGIYHFPPIDIIRSKIDPQNKRSLNATARLGSVVVGDAENEFGERTGSREFYLLSPRIPDDEAQLFLGKMCARYGGLLEDTDLLGSRTKVQHVLDFYRKYVIEYDSLA